MEELINVLNEMFDNSIKYGVVKYPEDPYRVYFKESDKLREAEGLCCEYLITADGHCNWENILTLRDAGYRVFAGERDSFGWLVGCIQKANVIRTPHLTLLYG